MPKPVCPLHTKHYAHCNYCVQAKELNQLMEDYLKGLLIESEVVNRFILIMTGK